MPVGFAETIARQAISDLLERPAQPHEVAIAPEPRLSQLALVEVDHIDLGVLVEKQVMCVEIRMTHAQIMESPYATADGDPRQNRERTGGQALGQRTDG